MSRIAGQKLTYATLLSNSMDLEWFVDKSGSLGVYSTSDIDDDDDADVEVRAEGQANDGGIAGVTTGRMSS